MKFKVEEQFAGIRLDKFLAVNLSDRTRAFLQKLIKDGEVFVNEKKVLKNGSVLKIGDEVEVNIPELKEIKAKAEKIVLNILYEDKDIIVIDKPAGMVVHPSETGGHEKGTVVNAILHHCGGELTGISGELRPGIVHRLDKDTSGVLIVAKTDLAQQSLMEQFSERKVKKEYIALVKGKVEPSHAIIDSPIGRAIKERKKMAITSEGGGRKAVTEYEVEKFLQDEAGIYSLIKAYPKTGRTHQIRVHMNAIGHPVVGDILYGDSKVNKHFEFKYGLKRQFLHAHKLTVFHPRTKKELTFESKLPNELKIKLLSL
jgi:23S rRNA pseudouridine1911/1915/1917 synthase